MAADPWMLASNGATDQLRLALAAGSVSKDDVKTTGLMKGWRLLHAAAAKGQVEVIRMLVELGVDASARDGAGRTALDLAHGRGHATAARLLSDHHETQRLAATEATRQQSESAPWSPSMGPSPTSASLDDIPVLGDSARTRLAGEVKEYLHSGDADEVLRALIPTTDAVDGTSWSRIKGSYELALEHAVEGTEREGQLLSTLVARVHRRAPDKGTSAACAAAAVQLILEMLDDILLDSPKALERFAQVATALVEARAVRPEGLASLIRECVSPDAIRATPIGVARAVTKEAQERARKLVRGEPGKPPAPLPKVEASGSTTPAAGRLAALAPPARAPGAVAPGKPSSAYVGAKGPARSDEPCIRELRSILNKLTPEKLDTLCTDALLITIPDRQSLIRCTELLVAVAVGNPVHHDVYSAFAKAFAQSWRGTQDGAQGGAHFTHHLQQMLLTTVLDFLDDVDAGNTAEEHWPRRRSVVTWIGSLARAGVLSAKCIVAVVDELLSGAEDAIAKARNQAEAAGPRRAADECAELSCKLLATATDVVGAEEVKAQRGRLGALAAAEGSLSSRVRFMIQGDVNKRHTAPTTLAGIRNSAPTDLHDLLKGETGAARTPPTPSLTAGSPALVTRTVKRRLADGSVEEVKIMVPAERAGPQTPETPSKASARDGSGRGRTGRDGRRRDGHQAGGAAPGRGRVQPGPPRGSQKHQARETRPADDGGAMKMPPKAEGGSWTSSVAAGAGAPVVMHDVNAGQPSVPRPGGDGDAGHRTSAGGADLRARIRQRRNEE